ncbi:MAG: DUF1638 domain-containing protein [Firmicutes bacterium]|nr:DUF1638 domain-containing protein [Bacillota bacterium]
MTVILTCSSLKDHVDAAQKAMGTDLPVVVLDRSDHVEPARMQASVLRAMDGLVKEYPEDLTVLVSMGFCGGVWHEVSFPCRVVIPRADDCISIMLATDEEYIPNRKEAGHLYLYEKDPADFSALKMLHDGGTAEESYRNMSREDLFRYWFGNYYAMDIIDTGLNPCYEESYVEAAQKEADAINAQLGYAQGGNVILEKLVSGRWDRQFIVAEPGQVIKHSMFFE